MHIPTTSRRARRRTMLHAAAAALLACAAAPAVHADSFPSRPVKILIGNPPGGTSDLLARLVGNELAKLWQQPVVVENLAGASGSIAMNAVVRAAPDGYTLGLANLNHVVFEALSKKPPYMLAKNTTPLVALARQSNILVVAPSLPVRTPAELVAYAKAQSRPLSFASGGSGSPSHLAGELFKLRTGVDLLHVPYRGSGPAVQDVMAGNVTMMFAATPSALPQVAGGTLRGLAVTGDVRSPQSPQLPTLKESGFDVVVRDWQGLVGPAGLPADVVARINADVRQVLARPEIQARIAAGGAGEAIGGSTEDFAALLRDEAARWKGVVEAARLTTD